MRTASFFGLKRSTELLALLVATLLAGTAWGDEPRLSISGYDPVAYFTDGKPVQGKPEFEYLWHRLRWRFASGEHRDLFTRNPKQYAPQYDGYCAMGTSDDEAAHKDTVDPEAWAIVDGKLYLAHNRYLMRGMAGKREGAYPPSRPRLGGRQRFASTRDRRAAVRRFSAHDQGRAARWWPLGRRRWPGRARRGRQCCGQRRSAGADRTSWQERRCLPQCRRRDGQGHYFYGSATSHSPSNSTNTPICASAISARLRRRVRRSLCRNWLTRIFWCRSRPSPRSNSAG